MLRRSLVAALLLICSAHAIAQGRASIVGLGTLGGGTHSVGSGINASGQVTGYADTAAHVDHAFLYSGGAMQDLGTLGGSTSVGNGINASAQVTGYANTSGNPVHAFLYSGGSMQDLGTVSGGFNSYGYALNASGQVTGYGDTSGNALHAFVYSGGSMRDLGTLGGANSFGYGINASGQVTGFSYYSGTLSHAFIYSAGTMLDIGTLGGLNSFGYGINAGGQVTGVSNIAGNSAQHAFLYSGGGMQDLGTLGGSYSQGDAINTMGQVTGTAYVAGDAAQHAFLYAGGRMFDLNTFAPAGWTLVEGRALNDNAQITGNGIHNGHQEAFIVTLQPDWQDGNGSWADASRWSFGGLGAMGITPNAPHDVLINPAGSATVLGAAEASVRSLRIAGNAGQIVTLNLNGGATTASNGTIIDANGSLAGSGRLGGTLSVNAGGHVDVADGERMQLTGGTVTNNGAINVLGSAASPARLSIGGAATNAGQINLQSAAVSFFGGLSNSGRVNSTFGISTIAGSIRNLAGGTIVVSNGAQVSFFDPLVNNGELRVSAGGASNFFALVSGAGSFTGTGQSRFEGGFSPGNSPALVTVNTVTFFSSTSPIIMELGGLTPGSGHDKIVFTNAVTLEGGDLDVVWYGGWSGSAGDVYDLFGWNGTLSGTFGHLLLPTLADGLAWDTAGLYTTGAISIAAIPEAETYAMLLAGFGLLGFIARRKRRPAR